MMATVKFDKMAFMRKVTQSVSKAVAGSAIELQEEIQHQLSLKSSSITSGGTPSLPGLPPALNTGALRRSIVAKNITTEQLKPTWRVGTNLIYARIQEFGGYIHAKKSKFLTIPLGVDGRRAARNAKGNIRSLNLTFLVVNGKPFLGKFLKRAKAAIFKPLFILKKKVYLPPRPYMRPARIQHEPKLRADITAAIAWALKGYL